MFGVTILGNNSAVPAHDRHPTAQAVTIANQVLLLDCGEGTQQQMLRFDIKASRIDHIFISHLHGDHYLGLIGLLSSLHLNGRVKPLYIFCPEPLKEIIDLQFRYSETSIQYPIEYVFTNPVAPAILVENQDIIIESIPLNHRIACTGFLFRQKKRLRKLVKEKIEKINEK